MTLPIKPPFPPMEALLVSEIPAGDNWEYEPKWDGFRCLAFRDGKTVELQSKSGQPLERYFPEIVAALLKVKATKFVLDGELVIPVKDGLSFDDLLQRIHPAASRVAKLAQQTPAQFVVSTNSLTMRAGFTSAAKQAARQVGKLREEVSREESKHRTFAEDGRHCVGAQVALNHRHQTRRRDC